MTGAFIQELSPELQDDVRQTILRGRATVKRMHERATETTTLPTDLATEMMRIATSQAFSQMQFEAVAALRWGVQVPRESQP